MEGQRPSDDLMGIGVAFGRPHNRSEVADASITEAQHVRTVSNELQKKIGGSNDEPKTALAALARRSNGLQLRQLIQQAQKPQLIAEATSIVQGLPAGVIAYARQQLQGVPENVVLLAVALCSYRRGMGGRHSGPDPHKTPGICPKKAARILANRCSAQFSKIKKKLADLAEQAKSQVPEQPSGIAAPQKSAAAAAALPVIASAFPQAGAPHPAPDQAAPAAMHAQQAAAAASPAAAAAATACPAVAAVAGPAAAAAAGPAVAAVGLDKEQQQDQAWHVMMANAHYRAEELLATRNGQWSLSTLSDEPQGPESMDYSDAPAAGIPASLPAEAEAQQLLLPVQGLRYGFKPGNNGPMQLLPDTATATTGTAAAADPPRAAIGAAGCSSSMRPHRAPIPGTAGHLVRAMQLGHLQQALFRHEEQLLQSRADSAVRQQQQQQQEASTAAGSVVAEGAPAAMGNIGPVNPPVALPGAASTGLAQQGFSPDAAFNRLAELQRQHQLLSRSEAGSSSQSQQAAMLGDLMHLIQDLLAAFRQIEQQELQHQAKQLLQQQQQPPQPQQQQQQHLGSPHQVTGLLAARLQAALAATAPCSAAHACLPEAAARVCSGAPLAMHAASAAPGYQAVTQVSSRFASAVPAAGAFCPAPTAGMQHSNSNAAMAMKAARDMLAACILQLQETAPTAATGAAPAALATAGPNSFMQLQNMGSSTLQHNENAAAYAPAHVAAGTVPMGQASWQMVTNGQQLQPLMTLIAQQQQGLPQAAAGLAGQRAPQYGGHDVALAAADNGSVGRAAQGQNEPSGGLQSLVGSVGDPSDGRSYDEDLLSLLLGGELFA